MPIGLNKWAFFKQVFVGNAKTCFFDLNFSSLSEIHFSVIIKMSKKYFLKTMPKIKKIKTEKTELAVASVSEKETSKPKKMFNAKLVVGFLAIIFFSGTIFFGGYFYWQYKKVLATSIGKNVLAPQSEVKILTEKLGKVLELPSDEEPTIAEVKDKEKLKGQLFFSSAQNGDKVLLYTNNRRAVLYRPETDKIIEMASLGEESNDVGKNEDKSVVAGATDSEVSGESQSVLNNNEKKAGNSISEENQTEKTLENTSALGETVEGIVSIKRVVVYNGTVTKGLAGKLADEILTSVPDVKIVATKNALGNYSETIIVDLSGNNAETTQKIVATVGGKLGELPVGEKNRKEIF